MEEKKKEKMDRADVLGLLQDSARELTEKVRHFHYDKAERLAEFMSIWRAVNAGIQQIIYNCEKSEIAERLDILEFNLHNEILHYQELGLTGLAELSAIALSAVYDYESEIQDYYKDGGEQ